jgi:hypothetical protein
VQALLKQREAAVGSLSAALDAARARPGGGGAPPAVTPRGPLSRQNSDEEALVAELHEKAARIRELEGELAELKARAAQLTPRRPTRREEVEESGVAVVGGGGLSAYEANRMRALRTEAESWRDRAESLMGQVKELQRGATAADAEKAALADGAAALGERCAGLEAELRAAREQLVALRALADQGRGELKGALQRRDSDLAKMAAAADAQAAEAEGMKAAAARSVAEREQLALQVAALQAQLAHGGDEAREAAARVAALQAQLDEKAAALEASEVISRYFLSHERSGRSLGISGGQPACASSGDRVLQAHPPPRPAHQLAPHQPSPFPPRPSSPPPGPPARHHRLQVLQRRIRGRPAGEAGGCRQGEGAAGGAGAARGRGAGGGGGGAGAGGGGRPRGAGARRNR